jgi:hypothetical protein
MRQEKIASHINICVNLITTFFLRENKTINFLSFNNKYTLHIVIAPGKKDILKSLGGLIVLKCFLGQSKNGLST